MQFFYSGHFVHPGMLSPASVLFQRFMPQPPLGGEGCRYCPHIIVASCGGGVACFVVGGGGGVGGVGCVCDRRPGEGRKKEGAESCF